MNCPIFFNNFGHYQVDNATAPLSWHENMQGVAKIAKIFRNKEKQGKFVCNCRLKGNNVYFCSIEQGETIQWHRQQQNASVCPMA